MFEVEIRFIVERPDEAYTLLPFLQNSLRPASAWQTDIIGKKIFHGGRLLRVGWMQDSQGDGVRSFLGYKEIDQGSVANIREEWGEEITHGTTQSEILQQIGLRGAFAAADEVLTAIYEAGHRPFMSFSGEDQLGYFEPLQVHTKLCRCADILGENYLIELELEAATLDEAKAAEKRLMEIADEYHLLERLIRDEPPTMLYQAYRRKEENQAISGTADSTSST